MWLEINFQKESDTCKNFLEEKDRRVLWSSKLMCFQASLSLQGLSTEVDLEFASPLAILRNVSWGWEVNPVFHTFI